MTAGCRNQVVRDYDVSGTFQLLKISACSVLTRIRRDGWNVVKLFIVVSALTKVNGGDFVTFIKYNYCAMLCMRGTSHGPVSVSVCLSVKSRSSTKTAKRRIT